MRSWTLVYLAVLALTVGGNAALASELLTAIEAKDVVTRQDMRVDFSQQKIGTAVVFLSARCPCSASHEATLKNLSKTYSDVQFVGIHSNFDESAELTKIHFERSNFPFPVLEDQDQRIANHFGALKTPHVFLLNLTGQIVFEGGVDDSRNAEFATKHYFEKALAALKQGRMPETREARALGCFIKRKKV